MAEDPEHHISAEEVEAFVRKLEQWSEGLDEKEKILLQAILTPPESDQVPMTDEPGIEFDRITVGVPLENLMHRLERRAYVKQGGGGWVKFIKHHPV
ncbi:hypothetical protein ACWGJW_15590 [Streptomyces nigrescens]